jgi:hypothetical protein
MYPVCWRSLSSPFLLFFEGQKEEVLTDDSASESLGHQSDSVRLHAECFDRGPMQTTSQLMRGLSPIEQIVRGSLIETHKPAAARAAAVSTGRGTAPSDICRRSREPASVLGYVPNAAYPQVAAYRKLQEMLNEICAINAALLRRRESLD